MASAASTSSSAAGAYSHLLRRSRLATLNPKIDQVYTAPASSRARQNNYGLKRPLPHKSTRAQPFVRVVELDSQEGRTQFRKAARETNFTRQWSEVGVGIHPTVLGDRASVAGGGGGGGRDTRSRAWARPEVQSRFVPAHCAGSILQPGEDAASLAPMQVDPAAAATLGQDAAAANAPADVEAKGMDAATAAATADSLLDQPVPNFFLMQPQKFERFLDDLGRRRSEFRAFVAGEENKRALQLGQPASADAATYDLYAHAQRDPVELVRLVERFLRIPSELDDRRAPGEQASRRDPALADPVPLVHPTLALQYAPPTPLESSLAPPIEGRILGPVNDAAAAARSGGGRGANTAYDRRNKVYAHVLSQVSMINANAAGNVQPTTWFPDVAGERSNVAGRASFRVQPTINPTTYAIRAQLARSGFYRSSVDFRPPTEEHQSDLLDNSRLETNPTALPAEQLASIRPLPGTQAYSGNVPREVRSPHSARASGSSSFGGAFGLGSSLTDLWRDGRASQRAERAGLGSSGDVLGAGASRRRRPGDFADPIAQLRARRAGQGQGQGQGHRRAGSGSGSGRKGQANERSRELIGKLQSLMGGNGGDGGNSQ